MEKKVIVAPVGANMDALYVSIREVPAQRVVLLATEGQEKIVEATKKSLSKFQLPTEIITLEGNVWEDMFEQIGQLAKYDEDLIVNVGTGDTITASAASAAAFVNGLKVMSVENGKSVLFPLLRFSYYSPVSDKKLKILKSVKRKGTESLEELGTKANMSLPLVSYHVNGNLKSEGLKDMGLIDIVGANGRLAVNLSTMGRMLLKGHVGTV